jgi:hypothetical protein
MRYQDFSDRTLTKATCHCIAAAMTLGVFAQVALKEESAASGC